MTISRTLRVKQAVLLSCMFLSASPASARDVWDLSTSDNNSGTDNELIHGSDQVHDLETGVFADQDWFLLSQAPYSSYEVIVDGVTEEVASINEPLRLDVVDSAGTTLQSGVGISTFASSRTLRVRNATGSDVTNRYIRVQGPCGTLCTANAQYRIRMRETTLMIPRFNNSGSQITVLIMQNGSRSTVAGTVRFWSTAGVLLASSVFSMPTRGGAVINTSVIAGATGASGVMTVDHDGRYGEVTGKSVALEPATGFSFDTQAVPRFF